VFSPIDDDGQGNVACYNDELSTYPEEEKRWFSMNWLFAECYLYVPSFHDPSQIAEGEVVTDDYGTTSP